MGMYKDLDIMIQEVSMTPQVYDLNKEMIVDYLSGDINSLPQSLQDVIYAWEKEQSEDYGTETQKNEKIHFCAV